MFAHCAPRHSHSSSSSSSSASSAQASKYHCRPSSPFHREHIPLDTHDSFHPSILSPPSPTPPPPESFLSRSIRVAAHGVAFSRVLQTRGSPHQTPIGSSGPLFLATKSLSAPCGFSLLSPVWGFYAFLPTLPCMLCCEVTNPWDGFSFLPPQHAG